jgi:hypothetical protein
MVYFQTKNPQLGKFRRVIGSKLLIRFHGHLEYFTDIWDFFDHLVHFVFIWYIISGFGICTKKNLATLGEGKKSTHAKTWSSGRDAAGAVAGALAADGAHHALVVLPLMLARRAEAFGQRHCKKAVFMSKFVNLCLQTNLLSHTYVHIFHPDKSTDNN